MSPDLDRRLADLADAAARATTGIDPAATLAVFRRRRRTRVAASTVTAVAALVGLAFGVAQLSPRTDVGPAVTPDVPVPTSVAPTPSAPSDTALACGLPPGEAFAALSGVPTGAHELAGSLGLDLGVEVDASGIEGSRTLSTSSIVAFAGSEPPEGATAPYRFTVWLLVTGPDGTVVGVTPSWEQPDKERVEGRPTTLERCPDASWSGIAEPELFHVHTATAPVGDSPSARLGLGDVQPLFRPEQATLDGPGSCGRAFFLDGVSESTGAALGLTAELTDLAVTANGGVTGYVVIRNNAEQSITGAFVLSQLLVENHDGPFWGSVLTLPEPFGLSDVVSIRAGGVMRVELDLETDACGEGILPLDAGGYGVSVIVDLVTPGEDVGFSSPIVDGRVD